MKKNEKYIAVNNQEDEDGYTLYPGYAIDGGNIKENQTISALRKPSISARNSSKPAPANFTISASPKPGRDKK